jgi:cob(I)alamin adenosyltransferase
MKIYTRTGDKGETSLLGSSRVSKASLRVWAYGDVDELNSYVGLLRSELRAKSAVWIHTIDPLLFEIQNQLFNMGSRLASINGSGAIAISSDIVKKLEMSIDQMEAELPPLKNFVLPGGGKLAATAHVLRTVSRRAERQVVALHEAEPTDPEVLTLLNRLSDYFFVLARYLNLKEAMPEVVWKP